MNMDSPSRAVSDEAVLRIVREVLTELHPGRKDMGPVTLDSALEEDLGLDSLARVELLMRLERAFGVRPPEQLLSTAEAPRDLLRALLATLYASASYIAAPAAMRIAVPQANPVLSIGAALGITFPFNLVVGIPLYHRIAQYLHHAGA